jgi:hypothetical protein
MQSLGEVRDDLPLHEIPTVFEATVNIQGEIGFCVHAVIELDTISDICA